MATFSFVIPRPDEKSDQAIRRILDQILEALKHPKLRFLLVGGGEVEVDGAVDGDSSSRPGPPGPPPGAVGPPPGSPDPPSPRTVTAGPPAPRPQQSTLSVLGKTGPIQITFDEQRRLVATNTDAGAVTRSADPVDAASVELSKASCFGWVTWVAATPLTNAAPEASLADGWIFGMQPGCTLPASITCPANAMCAAGLKNGGAGSGPLDLGAMKWPSAARIASQPNLATDLEYRLMRAKARARLFPQRDLVPVNGEWRCAVPEGDSCKAAVEWTASGPVAFASVIGSTFTLNEGSLLKWAAVQPDKAPAKFFAETDTSDLRVLGQAVEGWLVQRTQTKDERAVTSLSSVRSAGGEVPVEAIGPLRSPGQNPWEAGRTSRLLEQAAQSIGRSKATGTWHIDDPGRIAGGSRILLTSATDIILLSTPESAGAASLAICRRETTVAKASAHPAMLAARGPTLTAKLYDLITMDPDTWRQRGLKVNPVLSLFGNSCR